MGIVTYAAFSYLLMAVISFGVVAIIVVLSKLLGGSQKKEDK